MVLVAVVLALAGASPFAAAPAGAATGPNYTVFNGVVIPLCGVHNFGTLTLDSGAPGGTIRVAGVASNANTTGTGPDCPAGSENELTIRADTIINHGTISADALQAPPFTPVLAPCDPPYQPPTGNSGGGHGAVGGHGSTGAGGSQYDTCDIVLAGLDAPGFNPGAPGAGTGSGGSGGGVIVLISNGDLVSDGAITADGQAGTGNMVSVCATSITPNLGAPAPRGGGAGGRIILAARNVDLRGTTTNELHANGGAGGTSGIGPSGGGAGGVITVMGPLRQDNTWVPIVDGGAAGTNLCAGDGQSVNAGSGGVGTYHLLAQVRTGLSTQASAGSSAGVHDVATLLGAGPTGTVTFRLFSDSSCTTQVFTSTNAVTDGTSTSTDYVPAAAGTYYWTAAYSGDAVNAAVTSPCNAPNESVTITKASPTIATQASPGGLAGAPVRDVATLSGGLNPTGTVTFRLYSDATCATQVFTSTVPVSGAGATSEWFTPATPGTYRWTAAYSGDGLNNPATSPCNAPNESATITPFQAPAPTQTITGDFVGPVTVNAGQSVVFTSARVVGPVTVNPGGALTVVNSQVSGGITANAPAFFSLCGAQVAPPAPGGVALSVTNATVPIRVGDPAAGCAGNRFAGRVSLTGNLAVTFGANTVSHSATIDTNGPGSTVVKANTLFGTLGCAGNNPPPTNAGQPNSAAAKTGQCAGL
ncbi:MAG TPA: hypothetical protein VJ653_04200 [Acidimicrobiales bacterium]|nr:hypothetical protein [Acidimicrobiales bacterium]